MGVSNKQLQDERTALKKTFDELTLKIQTIEKESQTYKNNLNAVGGAIQQIDKLLHISKETGKTLPPEERENPSDRPALDITQSKSQLLNEGEK